MNPPLHPSQEGNLQPLLQTKLHSPEGHGVGSWVQSAIKVRGNFSPFLIALAARLVLTEPTGAESPARATVPPGMVPVPAGFYRPLFRDAADPKEIPVKGFALDVFPVTRAEYLEFVRVNPRWRRSEVKRLFADGNYLKDWTGDLEPGAEAAADAPVTWVSWFAAKAYASWRGKRLPTVAEWEYAASASPTRLDGVNDPEFRKQILQWHSTPAPERLPRVGAGRANYFGVHDLHGLVWEWVADFNTALVTGDARAGAGIERRLFCGNGSQGAQDATDYPAFLRFGFWSSLKASYTVPNLGFRCAKDL